MPLWDQRIPLLLHYLETHANFGEGVHNVWDQVKFFSFDRTNIFGEDIIIFFILRSYFVIFSNLFLLNVFSFKDVTIFTI
jgi:hypothetical protein